jgi:hypothetical protein
VTAVSYGHNYMHSLQLAEPAVYILYSVYYCMFTHGIHVIERATAQLRMFAVSGVLSYIRAPD